MLKMGHQLKCIRYFKLFAKGHPVIRPTVRIEPTVPSDRLNL
jgi:hypothetical protein